MTWAGRRGGAAEGDDHGVDAPAQDVDALDGLDALDPVDAVVADDVDVEPVDEPGADGDSRWGGWASDASI